MGYLIAGLLLAALVVAFLAAQVVALPVVISVVLLAATGSAVVRFGQTALRVLRATDPAGPSPDPVPAGPAWQPYVLVQGWRDLAAMASGTAARVWADLSRPHRRFWPWVVENTGGYGLIGLPTGLGLVAGTALVVVPVGAGLVALVAVQAAVLAVWSLGWLATAGTLGAAELGLRGLRRVVLACPHPGCYHRFGLPVYACANPACDQRHPRLVPGRMGALRHACRCGAGLPTLGLLGRFRLTGFCPRCDRPLPGRVGRVRIEHVPIVGGPDAGKSTFLCLSIGALTTRITDRGGTVDYPDHRDQTRWTRALGELRRGVRLPKTVAELPTAVMLDVRPRHGDGRILYLFDPAGESYDAAEGVDTQRYLDHAGVAVVVVDPLAIANVADGFTDSDRQVVARAAAPSQTQVVREGPGPIVDRLTAVLRSRPAGGRLRRLLVVLSKSDVLRETSVGTRLAGPAPDVPGWLAEVGWGNWVRTLGESAGQVRYLASGLDVDPDRLAETIGWLAGLPPGVAGAGERWSGRLAARLRRLLPGWLRPRWPRLGWLRLGWLRTAWRAARRRSRRPAATGRPGRIPAGHVAGRRLAGLLGAPAALLAGLATAAAMVALFLSVYA